MDIKIPGDKFVLIFKKMNKNIFLILLFLFCSCEKDDTPYSFLEAHSEKMWKLIEDDRYNSINFDEYIGFSSNKSDVLVYKTNFYNTGYGGSCVKFREGETTVPISECAILNNAGFYDYGESIIIYSIIENSPNLLIIDDYLLDNSCETIIKETYRRSYNIDGDFLIEDNTSDLNSYIRKYSLSQGSYDELCK